MSPQPGTATEEDVIRLLENPGRKGIAELIDDILVEKPVRFWKSILTSVLAARLWNPVEPRRLGIVAPPVWPFRLGGGNVRFPDVSFVPWSAFEGELKSLKSADFPPVLAVEILSESNTPTEIATNLAEYFNRGCKPAWIIDPATEAVTVYTSANRGKAIPADGELTGGKVLPGFVLKLSDLFATTKRPPKK